MGRWSVCSASPELFFRLQNEILESRPMKGTASRGRTTRDDEEAARRLRESEKDRAENLMIVDMIRNDIGRVADVGSVAVPRLCDVERFPFPVRIDHRGPEDRHDGDHRGIGDNAARPVLRHHRVPGAGRRSRPRPVQRGDPHGHDRPRRRHRPNTEWAEASSGIPIPPRSTASARSRRASSARATPEFELLEAILWTPADGCYLRDRHMSRLEESARYFGIPLDPAGVRAALDELTSRLPPEDHKVRIVVSEITESSTANVVAEVGGVRVTPPVSCGLLAGTFRAHILDEGTVTERILTPADIRSASALWLVNSVRRWMPVVLVDE